jgi:hypothetical protein
MPTWNFGLTPVAAHASLHDGAFAARHRDLRDRVSAIAEKHALQVIARLVPQFALSSYTAAKPLEEATARYVGSAALLSKAIGFGFPRSSLEDERLVAALHGQEGFGTHWRGLFLSILRRLREGIQARAEARAEGASHDDLVRLGGHASFGELPPLEDYLKERATPLKQLMTTLASEQRRNKETNPALATALFALETLRKDVAE